MIQGCGGAIHPLKIAEERIKRAKDNRKPQIQKPLTSVNGGVRENRSLGKGVPDSFDLISMNLEDSSRLWRGIHPLKIAEERIKRAKDNRKPQIQKPLTSVSGQH